MLLLILFLLSGAQSQSCGVQNGYIYITSQSQLNNFNCAIVNGSLSISGDITDLTPLSRLTAIELSFDLKQTSVTSLNGLENLQTIGEQFFIHENSKLQNLRGLSSLKTIGGGILVYRNALLSSISGLSSLTSINPTMSPKYLFGISIYSNPLLTSLSGLTNLNSLGNLLYIGDMPRVKDFTGLPLIPWKFNNITIDLMIGISTLSQLSVYRNGDGATSVRITSNSLITSLNGLNGFSNITNLKISFNPELMSVSDIASSNISSFGDIDVSQNGKLCDFSGLDKKIKVVNSCGKSTQVQDRDSFDPNRANTPDLPSNETRMAIGIMCMIFGMIIYII